MSSTDIEPSEITKWDPGLTERVMGVDPAVPQAATTARRCAGWTTSRPAARWWWPTTPAACSRWMSRSCSRRLLRRVRLRPAGLHAEPRHALRPGRPGTSSGRSAYIRANHENADEALRSGGVVVVFPGGDYDVYRPTFSENMIDFDGRTGYVKAALNAGVPIVPTVGDRRPGDARSTSPAGPGWPSGCGSTRWSARRSCRSRSASRSA